MHPALPLLVNTVCPLVLWIAILINRKTKKRSCRECGKSIFGLAARCEMCQAIVRVNRRADRPCVQKRTRIKPSGRNPDHLSWIRTLSCTVPGCTDPSVAAHVRQGTGGGMGLKPPDEWSVPLCHAHHSEQHAIGHLAFDLRHNLCLRAEAERLAVLSPHTKAGPL